MSTTINSIEVLNLLKSHATVHDTPKTELANWIIEQLELDLTQATVVRYISPLIDLIPTELTPEQVRAAVIELMDGSRPMRLREIRDAINEKFNAKTRTDDGDLVKSELWGLKKEGLAEFERNKNFGGNHGCFWKLK